MDGRFRRPGPHVRHHPARNTAAMAAAAAPEMSLAGAAPSRTAQTPRQ